MLYLGKKGGIVLAYTVITGASCGIGHGIALAFAKRGHNLILTGRNEASLLSVQKEILNLNPYLSCLIYPMDLSDEEALMAFFSFAYQQGIDTWINNAGMGYRGKTRELSFSHLKALLDLNVKAVALLSTRFIKEVGEGTLINVASFMGYHLTHQASLYSASKFFISSFSEALYYEVEAENLPLRIKLYAPSAVKTNFSYVAGGLEEKDYDKVFSRYHTKEEAGEQVYRLYESEAFLGLVKASDYSFSLLPPQHEHFLSKAYKKT